MSEETPQEEPQPVLAPPRRSLPVGQVLLGVLILVCGFIIGACCTILFAKDLIRRAGADSPEEMAAPISQQLTRQLNLTPEQRQDVRKIVEERMGNIQDLGDDMRKEFEGMQEDIRETLTEEQKQKLEEQMRSLRQWAPRGGQWGQWPRQGPLPGQKPGERRGARRNGEARKVEL